MAVSTSILPIISLVPISSRLSKTHHQDSLINSHHGSFRRLVINCWASSDMGSSPDPMNSRAVRHLENGRVVIFAAGTGNLFFTTDTAADLHCAEINAEVVLKARNVDGFFDDDPRHNPNARLRDTITYHEVMSKDLSVMDMTAITLCQENNIPVVVFNLNEPGNISKAIKGERVGTLIGGTQNSEVSRT